MELYEIKRGSDNLSMSRVAIVGPVPSDGSPVAKANVQKLEFNRQNSTIATCKLTSGKTYIAMIDMFGEIGGKISLSAKPEVRNVDYIDLGSLKIPRSAKARPSASGHVYSSAFHFTIAGAGA